MSERRVRVRFAPSPTGPLHPGGIRTALYNYLLAKQQGGDFILRVEDTDQNRFVPGAEEFIINALSWCGIKPNEGVGFGDGPHAPYRQSERKHLYRRFADQLIESGHAYYAFDTAEELETMRKNLEAEGVPNASYNAVTRQYMKNSLSLSKEEWEKRIADGHPYVIRFKMPRNEEVKFYDEIREWVVFNSSQLSDAILLKSDGMPTYHLANVSDDYMMEITHVIRGEEWLSSAPLHVMLYRALGIEHLMPKFAHLPLLLRPDGNGKLSKRDGDRLGFPFFAINWTSPEDGAISEGYREKGFFPEAFVNFLALLGWNPGENREIMTMDEMIQLFSLAKVHKAGARYDFEKAKWFNQQYLKAKPNAELAAAIKDKMQAAGFNSSDEKLEVYCGLIKERATFLNDLITAGEYLYKEISFYDVEALKKKWKPEVIEKWNAYLAAEGTTSKSADALINDFMQFTTWKTGEIMPLLRIALAGILQGPPVVDMAKFLETQGTINRLSSSFKKMEELLK
ncbi:MAG: glutamate--tRNA ligase [Chitinophagales bacterium]